MKKRKHICDCIIPRHLTETAFDANTPAKKAVSYCTFIALYVVGLSYGIVWCVFKLFGWET